jgi:integrase
MALTLRRHGEIWYFRGTVPFRKEDGTITKIRVEQSTRETSRARAARVAQDYYDHYQESAYRPKPKSVSFTEAAITYTKTKHPSHRDRQILARLIEHFGDKPISEIGQKEVADCCMALYPGCKASSLHRSVYAPVVMVLRLSGLVPSFKRPKIAKTVKDVPDADWFKALLPHCDPQLQAYLLFITLTGRRPTEALEAIYDGDDAVIIRRTKTDRPIQLAIPAAVLSCLGGGQRKGDKLFTFGDRHNVYRVLRRTCGMAGLPYYGLHAIGRHCAATRLLKAGYSTKFVADYLGHASTRMVDLHYGHLIKSEVEEEGQKVGEEWLKKA